MARRPSVGFPNHLEPGATMVAPARRLRMPVHMRWMCRQDLRAVLAIEEASFEFPWAADDFIACGSSMQTVMRVAEWRAEPVGYVVYERFPKRLQVLNLAVEPRYRRQDIGRQIMHDLKGKLETGNRSRITLECRERNLQGQLFFREMGFRAVSILKDFYDDTPEDAYLFQFRLRRSAATSL